MKWQTCRLLARYSFLVIYILVAGCASVTQPKNHVVYFSPNTEPPNASIVIGKYKPNDNIIVLMSRYSYTLSPTDMNETQLDLPDMTFVKEGYLPYEYNNSSIQLNDEFWKAGFTHSYHNTDKVVLKKDPDFWGSKDKPNKLNITINSEPQGAKIYNGGKLVGTTPYEGHWVLDSKHYKQGSLSWGPVVVVKEGFEPYEADMLTYSVDSDWRYKLSEDFEVANLFILKRDPTFSGVTQPYMSSSREGSTSSQYASAKREYDSALSTYNEALSKLDEAKNMKSLSDLSFGTMMSGSKTDRAISLLNKGTSHLSLQEAERNVEIARERLNRARARLDAMNWK